MYIVGCHLSKGGNRCLCFNIGEYIWGKMSKVKKERKQTSLNRPPFLDLALKPCNFYLFLTELNKNKE